MSDPIDYDRRRFLGAAALGLAAGEIGRFRSADANGAPHADSSAYAGKFSGKYVHRTVTGGVGHNLPQEAPQAFAKAILDAAAL